MSEDKSKSTSRIFDRINKNKELSPFYEYRDTAMSKMAPFKPEWIKQLRYVDNSDPNNPEVSYNNGHFMHQMTFFVGCVNFYYEINGKRYCEEMNTGDSNYISPYLPHSFTTRDTTKEAYIVAVTFSGNVRRSQKELYALGIDRVSKYKLDIKNENKAISQLIMQNMKNENLTEEMLENNDINIGNILDETNDKTDSEIVKIAEILNIEPYDLMVPVYKKEHEIVICKQNDTKPKFYPSQKSKKYKIYDLSRANKVPHMKGFNIEILSDDINIKDMFETSLHSYIYNYTDDDAEVVWTYKDKQYSQILKNGESLYVQPFIKHGFKCKLGTKPAIYISRVGGHINNEDAY